MMSSSSRSFGREVLAGSSKDWRIQFIQHLITGGIATAAHYIVMWLALAIHLLPALATTIGFIVGATTRFLFSYLHVFEPERNMVSAMPRFAMALILQMIANVGLLSLLLYANVSVWPSQLITTGFLAVINFMAHKFWVFR